MTDEPGRRIPIVDKRVAHQDPAATASGDDPVASGTPAGHESAPDGPDASPSGLGVDGPHGTASTPPALDGVDGPHGTASTPPALEDTDETPSALEQAEEVVAEQSDFLDDLKRLQADFDNYRKRMMREQAVTAGRAKARLIEQLLPVLDAFDQALAHEGSAEGMGMIAKQLRTTLEAEGLEEIPAENVPFDPHVHEAVDSREDPEVDHVVSRSVYRRGYKVGDQVLRAAMVVVARPPETEDGDVPNGDASEAAEG